MGGQYIQSTCFPNRNVYPFWRVHLPAPCLLLLPNFKSQTKLKKAVKKQMKSPGRWNRTCGKNQRNQYSKTLELNQVNVLYSISINNKVQDAEFSLSYLETSQDTDETEMMHFYFPFCFLISVLPLSRRWLQRSPHPFKAATLPKDDPPQISSAPAGIAVMHATSIHSHSLSPCESNILIMISKIGYSIFHSIPLFLFLQK